MKKRLRKLLKLNSRDNVCLWDVLELAVSVDGDSQELAFYASEVVEVLLRGGLISRFVYAELTNGVGYSFILRPGESGEIISRLLELLPTVGFGMPVETDFVGHRELDLAC